ncbi:MAG: NAD-glutamate dehydrogenase, partial [Agrobacterium vaccinii]
MDTKRNPKKDKQIDAARRIATKNALDPHLLFSRASKDDLANYTPEMLALSAEQARKALAGWDHNHALVLIEAVEGIEPAGTAVSVLTIVDRNQPFLYDSIMGEVTSSYRDLTLAVHPILHVENGKEPVFHPSDAPADPEHTVSLIQIHIPLLTAEQANDLEQRISKVLEQVHLAIADWQSMLARLETAITELSAIPRKKTDRDEALAFLEWLRDDNFTFLGMREYTYSGNGADARFERA